MRWSRRGPHFLAGYVDRLKQAYPRRATGKVLFPFRQSFIVASR